MDVSSMAAGIIKLIDSQYSDADEEYLDLVQIKNICNLYKIKKKKRTSVSLGDIMISSPDFDNDSDSDRDHRGKKKDKDKDPLKSRGFIRKYTFFIRIIYASLKMGVKIFNCDGNIITLKNNHQFLKTIDESKKQIINEHRCILNNYYRQIRDNFDGGYEKYVDDFIKKIRILDRVYESIDKLVRTKIIKSSDNMLSLILPYFYKWTNIIEEYNVQSN